MMQSVVRFLLRELPRMGMLFETCRVLQTAFQMERRWRPDGQAITEFDRLFDLALRNVLEEVIRSARTWGDEETRTEILIDAIGDIVEPFQDLWLDHSRTMRISSVDGLRDNDDWLDLADFIREYGGDLLHASQLTLGNVRAILHQGIDWYIDYLEEQQDPLRPMKMLEDLDSGMIDREHCEWCLETIYSIVVDKFDRFLEYNTTTTQSDYGNMFYCLLDFLRLEARYDRDSWSMSPITLVHEMLTRLQEIEAAKLWEGTYEAQTTDLAARHLQDLSGSAARVRHADADHRRSLEPAVHQAPGGQSHAGSGRPGREGLAGRCSLPVVSPNSAARSTCTSPTPGARVSTSHPGCDSWKRKSTMSWNPTKEAAPPRMPSWPCRSCRSPETSSRSSSRTGRVAAAPAAPNHRSKGKPRRGRKKPPEEKE
jgi:hypothetical protein